MPRVCRVCCREGALRGPAEKTRSCVLRPGRSHRFLQGPDFSVLPARPVLLLLGKGLLSPHSAGVAGFFLCSGCYLFELLLSSRSVPHTSVLCTPSGETVQVYSLEGPLSRVKHTECCRSIYGGGVPPIPEPDHPSCKSPLIRGGTFRDPRGCLRPRVVPNPRYCMYSFKLRHTYKV